MMPDFIKRWVAADVPIDRRMTRAEIVETVMRNNPSFSRTVVTQAVSAYLRRHSNLTVVK